MCWSHWKEGGGGDEELIFNSMTKVCVALLWALPTPSRYNSSLDQLKTCFQFSPYELKCIHAKNIYMYIY